MSMKILPDIAILKHEMCYNHLCVGSPFHLCENFSEVTHWIILPLSKYSFIFSML